MREIEISQKEKDLRYICLCLLEDEYRFDWLNNQSTEALIDICIEKKYLFKRGRK